MITRPLPAWLAYHVLAHLDLGADAATLFDPRLPGRPWVGPLARALDADRLRAQFAGLAADDVPALRAALGSGPLGDAWRAAVDAELGAVQAALDLDDPRARARRFLDAVEPDLARARAALYGGPPPPLEIVDVPALGGRARALTRGGRRRVATSLDQPPGRLFCQILHEEVHPHSDPIVRAALGDLGGRDTRVGQPGFAVHQALEVAAVEGGRQIVARWVPARLADYRAWCAEHGH